MLASGNADLLRPAQLQTNWINTVWDSETLEHGSAKVNKENKSVFSSHFNRSVQPDCCFLCAELYHHQVCSVEYQRLLSWTVSTWSVYYPHLHNLSLLNKYFVLKIQFSLSHVSVNALTCKILRFNQVTFFNFKSLKRFFVLGIKKNAIHVINLANIVSLIHIHRHYSLYMFPD